MPEHLRALVVILALAVGVFVGVRKPALLFIDAATFARWRNLWFAVTIGSFLAPNFWLYALAAILVLLAAVRRESNPVALFLFLLFAVPAGSVFVPGFGLINQFLSLNHVRVTELVLLLPTLAAARGKRSPERRQARLADLLVVAYCILITLLSLRETSFTNTLRQGVYAFLDIGLPYFAASRTLNSIKAIRECLLGTVLATFLLSVVAVFEYVRHWLLYLAVVRHLGLQWGYGYLDRGGSLRASGSVGHAIVLGYVVAVALGFFLGIQKNLKAPLQRLAGFGLLAGGLLASLSRGPWLGAAMLPCIYLLTGTKAVRRIAGFGVVAFLGLLVLSVLPGGARILDLVPFVGSVEGETIDYRQQLIDNAMVVIMGHPILGSSDYLNTPEMQQMIQGQGIIDVVNSYIGIALESGIVGLAMFVGVFATVLWGLYKSIRRAPDKDDESVVVGRALFATLVAMLAIIVTVSSISVIPILYWIVGGLCVAYQRLAVETTPQTAEAMGSTVRLAVRPRSSHSHIRR